MVSETTQNTLPHRINNNIYIYTSPVNTARMRNQTSKLPVAGGSALLCVTFPSSPSGLSYPLIRSFTKCTVTSNIQFTFKQQQTQDTYCQHVQHPAVYKCSYLTLNLPGYLLSGWERLPGRWTGDSSHLLLTLRGPERSLLGVVVVGRDGGGGEGRVERLTFPRRPGSTVLRRQNKGLYTPQHRSPRITD